MMTKATFFVDPILLNNRVFDMSDELSNRNNLLYGFYLLKEKLKEHNIDLSTQDINLPTESDLIIYSEMPSEVNAFEGKKKYLIIYESKVVMPSNWNKASYIYFDKIFTWDDDLVDDKKYFKIQYSNTIPKNLIFDLSKKDKFCALIAGNKSSPHPLELYSERMKTIRWFEKNHPEDFDLYGTGWDKYTFQRPFTKLNYIKPFNQLIKTTYPSYRGEIKSNEKISTLQRYKFSICYENARDVTGYITEKIIDCLIAGCVPVYWGAQNVADFIPLDAYIDRRHFTSHTELYNYIKNMSDHTYLSYLNAIEKFVTSDAIHSFTPEGFVDVLMNQILKDVEN